MMRRLLMIVSVSLIVCGATRRSNDTFEQGAAAAARGAATATALPQPSLFLVLAQPLRSINDLRSITSREEVDDPSRDHSEQEVEPSSIQSVEAALIVQSEEEQEQKVPDEDQSITRYMRPVRRKMMAAAQRAFVNRRKRHYRADDCRCRCCSCCRSGSGSYAYDDPRSLSDLTSRENADEPQQDFGNRRKRYNREDDCRCCRCPQSTRRRFEYADESSSFESRESSRDFHQRRPYPPPLRGDSRRRDDFERPPSEFPPSPRRRTYDWAPPPRRRYSSHHHRPPPSPRAAGPYHARGAGQRQGGCLNQMRCGSGAFARALQMKPSPFPWMPDWMSERGRPRRGMLLGLDSRYNQ